MELIVHIGAHRTGTTSLQQFLAKNAALLKSSGIELLCPPVTREIALEKLEIESMRAILSEENLLGTMEDNIANSTLYPNASRNLTRFPNLIGRASCVYMTIRSIEDWWNSALSFCLQKGLGMPDDKAINDFVESSRDWNDVVSEVVHAVPQARIVVREFNWKANTPKQHLNKLTGWNEWNSTTLDRRSHNRRPTMVDIVETLLERGDFSSLSKLPDTDQATFFSEKQSRALHERYQQDLMELRSRNDIEFWGEASLPTPHYFSSDTVDFKNRKTPPISFLNIGATGTERIKNALSVAHVDTRNVSFLGHGETLISTAKEYGRSRKLGFLFRKPEERFVEGFKARLRQGRPHYDVMWTPAEATSFAFFESPNDLAEGLNSQNERTKSAARFAFSSIFHLKHGYHHYLHSTRALEYEHAKGNILICCQTSRVGAHLKTILGLINERELEQSSLKENCEPELDLQLSVLGLKNIKEFWSSEYELYRTCIKISRELGYD